VKKEKLIFEILPSKSKNCSLLDQNQASIGGASVFEYAAMESDSLVSLSRKLYG